MVRVYPAVVHKDEDGFWLEFPDLSGCFTDGDNIEELMNNAEEALGTYLAVKLENKEHLPQASDISKIKKSQGDITTYVSADVNKYHKDTKAVKKMISIPSWLAKAAEEKSISLSKVLQEALLEKIS